MRTVVAVVEARPETIAEDYRRLLDLAGVPAAGDHGVTLAAQAGQGGWYPGEGCPPWQIAGVLDRLASGGSTGVIPVDPRRGPGSAAGWGWERVLAGRGAVLAGRDFLTDRPWRPSTHLPGLAAALPDDFGIPAGLAGPGTLGLLAVPSLDPAWPVAGAVRLLLSLVPGVLRRPRRLPPEVFLAESLTLAREVLAGRVEDGDPARASFAVLDGTVWEVGPGLRGRGPVVRNVLLAGTDPVAVDAVATRLTGTEPTRVPWLREIADRGLGAVGQGDIRIVGRTDLVDREFEMPAAGMAGAAARLPRLADLSWRITRRRAILRRHLRTPWGRLFEDYRMDDDRGAGR